MNIDYEQLREDLINFAYGAYFGGNIESATLYCERIKKASNKELLEIARECNFTISDYEIDDYKRKV